MHESFLSENTFCDSKKIFCDFSVGMELENEKTETERVITFAYNWLPFQCSKINNYEDQFSLFFMPYNKSFIDQATSVKIGQSYICTPHAFVSVKKKNVKCVSGINFGKMDCCCQEHKILQEN